jgi:superfamily II DNA/RNA helicase
VPLRDLAGWLLTDLTFVERYERVVVEAARAEMPEGAALADLLAEPHDWAYLLFAASVLAVAEEAPGDDAALNDGASAAPGGTVAAAAHAAALRIAQHCLTRGTNGADAPTDAQRAAAATLLDTLANRPAINLAIRRKLLPADVARRLPLPARIEWTRRQIENAVLLANDESLAVNRFQRRFWSQVEANDWISFSAPTSAGKSYIITHWVVDFVRRVPSAVVVYLVPTRALISQVEAEITRLVRVARMEHVSVSSLPLARSVVPGQANVLILTQERFHILQTAVLDLSVDVLIVDEAHKVGDGHRGVLLQQVVEAVARSNADAKLVFASPMMSNPETLVQDAPPGRVRDSFESHEVTVSQNLLWVSQVPRHPREWTVSLCLPDHRVHLGNLQLGATPSSPAKRLSFVAHALGRARAGNIVYVNGAADAEKVALQLWDLRGPEGDMSGDERIAALIELARRVVHPHFLLARVLARGVAFHYGNLPLLIRAEVERLFSEGVLHYLVCTSTLVEGVNMSCRSIFVRGPTKGRSQPMSAEDFWNLAGRAGRWGREFQGNVICVDPERPDLWQGGGAPSVRRRYAIRRTADVILARPEELIDFVRAGTPRTEANRRPELEYVFSYLMGQHLRFGSILELPLASRLDADSLARVAEVIGEAAAALKTPEWVVARNPGISPLAMDALLARFRRPGRDPLSLLPTDPSSEDAVDVYTAIFSRVAAHLNVALGPAGRRSFALALLVTRWMLGYPLSRLITDRIRLERERGNDNVPAAIRAVLAEVEQIARFEAPRSLACYTDLLRVYLSEVERPDLDVNTTRYPAVLRHLTRWKDELAKRPEVREGRYAWHCLGRYGAEYHHLFREPKIVFPDIAKELRFALDTTGAYLGNTCYFIASDDRFLLGVLNSSVFQDYYIEMSAQIRGGYLRFFRQYMEKIPVPNATPADREAVAQLVQHCLDAGGKGPQIAEWEVEINERVATLYGLKAAPTYAGVAESTPQDR